MKLGAVLRRVIHGLITCKVKQRSPFPPCVQSACWRHTQGTRRSKWLQCSPCSGTVWGPYGRELLKAAPPSGPLASFVSGAQVLLRALCNSQASQCSANSVKMLEQAFGWSKFTQMKICFTNCTAFLNVCDYSKQWYQGCTSSKAAW